MDEWGKLSIPMELVSTVCGAVKVLQMGSENDLKEVGDVRTLKHEGLGVAGEAFQRALSGRVLSMTSTGNFGAKTKGNKEPSQLGKIVIGNSVNFKVPQKIPCNSRINKTRKSIASKSIRKFIKSKKKILKKHNISEQIKNIKRKTENVEEKTQEAKLSLELSSVDGEKVQVKPETENPSPLVGTNIVVSLPRVIKQENKNQKSKSKNEISKKDVITEQTRIKTMTNFQTMKLRSNIRMNTCTSGRYNTRYSTAKGKDLKVVKI